MDCKTASVLMMKYMDMVLSEREAVELCLHVSECESCGYDFAIYKEMTAEFEAAGTSLLEPPDGFKERVMSAVYTVDTSCFAAYQQDVVTGMVFGVFSMLFGIGVMLSMHSAEIAEFLKGYPTVAAIIDATETAAETVSSFSDDIIYKSVGLLDGVYLLLDTAKYGILTIAAGLIAVQYAIYSRRNYKKGFSEHGEKSVGIGDFS